MQSSPLLRLPLEIVDAILSLVDAHEDIVAFALTSRACASIAIPRYTEYRILRIRHSRPELWTHLAHRADLASLITQVHISDRNTCLQPDRIPRTLVDPLGPGADHPEGPEGARIQNICKALTNMKSLRSFVWEYKVESPTKPTLLPCHEDSILAVLRRKTSLEYLALIGPFGLHAQSIRLDPDSQQYPLWGFSNLKRLNLFGDTWVKPGIVPHVYKLFQKTSRIEHLEIPLEFWYLHHCTFPVLKTLKLRLLTGASASLDSTRSLFIQRHPSLENLAWFPLGLSSLSPDALPNLKCLMTTRHVVECLASVAPPPPTPSSMSFATFQSLPPITEDPRESNITLPSLLTTIRRPIECLDVRSLDARSLLDLHQYFMEPAKLCKLKLSNFHDVDDVCKVGDVFSGITWLCLPNMHLPSGAIHPMPIRLNDLYTILFHFPRLEVLRGQALWAAVGFDNERMHLAILNLVQMLPHLRELDHSGYDDRRQGFKRIVLKRVVEVIRVPKSDVTAEKGGDGDGNETTRFEEAGEGYEEVERESVTYTVAKPKARDVWDIFDGSFD